MGTRTKAGTRRPRLTLNSFRSKCQPEPLWGIRRRGFRLGLSRCIRVILDNDTFEEFAMTFFEKGQSLAVVCVMLKSVLHKLKASIVLIQNLPPRL